MTKPSVGRIVHYVLYGTPGGEFLPECRAAIVAGVPRPLNDAQAVDLVVLNPAGMFFNQRCEYHEGDVGHDHSGQEIEQRSYPGGTWHWPEREPA